MVLTLLAFCSLGARLYNRAPTGSPFSVSHIKLGMTQDEVLAILGPGEIEHGFLYREAQEYGDEVFVYFDSEARVREVRGLYLELGEVEYITKESLHSFGPLPRELTAMLGEAAWEEGESGDFVHEWHYPEFNLVVEFGCGGWCFVLRQPGATPAK